MHSNSAFSSCSLSSCSEVILKTRNDNWVAAKFANLREFYVVLNTKNANLIEISGMYLFYLLDQTNNFLTEELTRLCESYLNCIFFTD